MWQSIKNGLVFSMLILSQGVSLIMPQRRKLGTVYTLSPFQKLMKWCAGITSKIFFTIVIWIIWFGVYYVILGIINFLGANLTNLWEEDIPTMDFFKSTMGQVGYVIGMILIMIYVFFDKLFRRK